eukprot:6192811-Pleurochrysis_carterae.AAC.1
MHSRRGCRSAQMLQQPLHPLDPGKRLHSPKRTVMSSALRIVRRRARCMRCSCLVPCTYRNRVR